MRPSTDIEGGKAAHVRLARTLVALSDEEAAQLSLLPGWTVGHVVTHLARNADSHVRMLEGAARGDVVDQYPGGNEQRAADIEAGSGRPAAVLAADATESMARLEAAWESTTDETWQRGQGRVTTGIWRMADLPFLRWREVEVHHADLGLRYGFADWPETYLDRELPRTLAGLPARLPAGIGLALRASDTGETWTVPDRCEQRIEVAGDLWWLLAWLIGRISDPSLPQLARW